MSKCHKDQTGKTFGSLFFQIIEIGAYILIYQCADKRKLCMNMCRKMDANLKYAMDFMKIDFGAFGYKRIISALYINT